LRPPQRSLAARAAAGVRSRWIFREIGLVLTVILSGGIQEIMTEHTHDTHPEIVKRLKRAHGHLKSVIAMIEDGKPCLDIAQQLSAVEKAIVNAKRTLIQDHLDHCLEETLGALPRDKRQSIDEFKTITKYL
jgi:DNA-binding FrmR family transcriptional regulator